MTWAATSAKAKFSEVLDRAEAEGPQLVRRRKREFVLMTREQHDAISKHLQATDKPVLSAWEALQPSAGSSFELELPKRRGKLRAAKF